MRISKLAAAIGLAAVMTASVACASDETELVAHATRVAEHMKSDPAFAAAHDMLGRARAVLIVPSLVKGGFVFGAEGGNGVLLKRNGRGWSSPAFYSMGSASFGLQIGLEKAEIVLLIMSDPRAARHPARRVQDRRRRRHHRRDAERRRGRRDSGHGGDIVVWTSATGAYGGLTFNGSVIKPRHEWNADYYGRKASVSSILSSGVRNPDSRELQAELAR